VSPWKQQKPLVEIKIVPKYFIYMVEKNHLRLLSLAFYREKKIIVQEIPRVVQD